MSDWQRIDKKIADINQRQANSGLPLKVERRGSKLVLRGILPPKPGSNKDKPHQQRISLDLEATSIGLEEAKKVILTISDKLTSGSFSWDDHIKIAHKQTRLSPNQTPSASVTPTSRPRSRAKNRGSLPAKIIEFEKKLFHGSNPIGEAAWQGAYMPYLKRLLLCAREARGLEPKELIRSAIESYPSNSRSRKICFKVMASFCQSMEIEFPFGLIEPETLRASKPVVQSLPSDEAIFDFIASVSNPSWRRAFGLIAAYGLRNYEVFFCDLSGLGSGDNSIRVCERRGVKIEIPHQRQVLPLYPDWVEAFQLGLGELPSISCQGATLQGIGQRVTQQMRRYGAPFNPKGLRGAWVARAILGGVPDTVITEMLGCSYAFMYSQYKALLSQRDTAFKAAWGSFSADLPLQWIHNRK